MADDERREKYARLLYEYNNEAVWPPDHDRRDWEELADAVMALADEEIIQARTRHHLKER